MMNGFKVLTASLLLLFGVNASANTNTSFLNKKSSSEKVYEVEELTSKNIGKIQREMYGVRAETPRQQRVKDVAYRLGLNVGSQREYAKRHQIVESQSAELDKIYNFRELAISDLVLPPVILQSANELHKDSSTELTVGGKGIMIYEHARVVSVYPTWRNYLKRDYRQVKIPDQSLTPRDKKEKQIWDAALKDGVEKGAEKAKIEIENSFAELKRDYAGMVLFHVLVNQGCISPTMISTTPLGTVITEQGSRMNMDMMKISITSQSKFNPNKCTQSMNPSTYKDKLGRNF